MSARVIPLFRAEHPRHGTVLEVEGFSEGLNLTVESYIDGKRDMGICFSMDVTQERELFNWMLSRRVVA